LICGGQIACQRLVLAHRGMVTAQRGNPPDLRLSPILRQRDCEIAGLAHEKGNEISKPDLGRLLELWARS
jgi:hypothetical protein